MSSKLKKFFGICGIFTLIGIILVIVGFATGGLKDAEKLDDKFTFISFGKIETIEYETGNFSDVYITNYTDRVRFVEGDKFSVTTKCVAESKTAKVEVKNGTLNISETINNKFLLMLDFGRDNMEPEVIITYPKGYVFNNVEVEITSGSLDMARLKSANTKLKGTNSNVDISDSQLGKLDVMVIDENMSIRSTKAESSKINAYEGNVDIMNSQLGITEITTSDSNIDFQNVITNNMLVFSSNSGMEINGYFYGITKISENEDSDSNISIDNMMPLSEFKLDINILRGDFEIDGENGFREEGENLQHTGGNAAAKNSIIVDRFVGYIGLDFAD